MRRMLVVVTAVSALFALVLGVVAVQSAPTATGRIEVTATLASASSRDEGKRGPRSNVTEQSWRVNDRFGRRIGRLLIICRWVTARARFCINELELPQGKIIATGSSPTRFEGEYAVTGGTGMYRGGGGTLLFTAIGLRKSVLLITITT